MMPLDTGTVHAIAFQPNQIKQTDPVTRDDQGNVIPLSERFNPENNDIRFRVYSVSEKSAEKGGNFYQDESGNIDLVKIDKEVTDKMGVDNLPLRLTTSMVDHIYEQHKREGKFASKQDAIEFVVDVMSNFDHVREGRDGTYVFSIEDGRENTGRRAITIILNSDSGDYFGVKTSGYERLVNIQKRPLIWEKGVDSSATDTASANVTSDSVQQGGEPIGNASNQTNGLSEYKDRINSDNTNSSEEISISDEPMTASAPEVEESAIRFRKVEDPAKIEELENGPKVKVYRSMQEIDGQLYPPMSEHNSSDSCLIFCMMTVFDQTIIVLSSLVSQ